MIVTVADVKAHLNVTFATDDGLIEGKIKAAQAFVEDLIGFSIADEYESGEVPEPLKEAVRQYAGHLYEHREPTVMGTAVAVPLGFHDLISNYREWGF